MKRIKGAVGLFVDIEHYSTAEKIIQEVRVLIDAEAFRNQSKLKNVLGAVLEEQFPGKIYELYQKLTDPAEKIRIQKQIAVAYANAVREKGVDVEENIGMLAEVQRQTIIANSGIRVLRDQANGGND